MNNLRLQQSEKLWSNMNIENHHSNLIIKWRSQVIIIKISREMFGQLILLSIVLQILLLYL